MKNFSNHISYQVLASSITDDIFFSILNMPKADSPPTTPMVTLDVDFEVKTPNKPLVSLDAAVLAAKKRFVEHNPNSSRLYDEACGSLPGGNTRTLLYSAPFPICMKKGEAYQVFDEDGHV